MEAVHHSAASITQFILLGAVHLRINAGETGASQRYFSDVGRNKEEGRKEGQMKLSLRLILEILHHSFCVLIVRPETQRGEMRIQSGPLRIMRE